MINKKLYKVTYKINVSASMREDTWTEVTKYIVADSTSKALEKAKSICSEEQIVRFEFLGDML